MISPEDVTQVTEAWRNPSLLLLFLLLLLLFLFMTDGADAQWDGVRLLMTTRLEMTRAAGST